MVEVKVSQSLVRASKGYLQSWSGQNYNYYCGLEGLLWFEVMLHIH